MPITVETHKRGILVRVFGGTSRSEVGRRIRRHLPSGQVLSSDGQFVLPPDSAHIIAGEFQDDGLSWSREAWALVQAQQALLRRMDAAKAEVAEALSCPAQSLQGY